ncbi:hypothetical protein [Actinomadura macra]|uniref:hypothetical protein n=1 Tax=Actinomadura macra TaxID=46164 RepID=UPI000B039A64|nr:hypothetical protein [Actinomadura macra]
MTFEVIRQIPRPSPVIVMSRFGCRTDHARTENDAVPHCAAFTLRVGECAECGNRWTVEPMMVIEAEAER